MDGLSLAAAAHEIESAILGSKIEKIYQPEKDELIIIMRGGFKLLLSAHANHCRAQLTRVLRANPPHPPMFCMLLRKHLTGAKICAVEQPNFERVLHIGISAFDEMGYEIHFLLIAELMGKHSNIILVRENGQIVDAIKHITPAVSSVRNVMPGLQYSSPPAQNKLNPLDCVSPSDVQAALFGRTGRLDKLIVSTWSGISPSCAHEISLRCGAADTPYEALNDTDAQNAHLVIASFFDMIRNKRFAPTLVLDSYGGAVAYFAFRPLQYTFENHRRYDYFYEALDDFYESRDRLDRMRQKGASLQRTLSNLIERNRKKLALQSDLLNQSSKLHEYRLYGELIIANAYNIERGVSFALVTNYYDESQSEIKIPLDPALSPHDNAQRYFKKYNKMKAAHDMAHDQILEISASLNYLEGTLDDLQKCTEESELLEIRQELVHQGYLREEKARRKQSKPVPSRPMRFISSDGTDIYVGKNNAQNEYLTLRFADSDDIWLHAKNIPGSHVIIKSSAPSEDTLLEAAHLAAYYSKARLSSQVPIDYAIRKHIKKPGGSPPGHVIYSANKTLYITPDESIIKGLTRVQ